MKRAIHTSFVVLFLCAAVAGVAQGSKPKSDNATGKNAKMKSDAAAMPDMNLAYTPTYSSQFVMGKPEQAKWVLDLYKQFETASGGSESPFADTVTFIGSDGTVLKGAEAVNTAFQQQRQQLSAVSFDISAVIPVHSIDQNTDWVLVWGREHVTPSSGAPTTVEFHSLWNINAAGKLAFVQFYEGKSAQ